MKICYRDKRFSKASMDVIEQADDFLTEYMADDLKMTLRQLFYVFVSAALIPNTDRSYDRIGRIISDGRMAGLIDWDAIEDRERELELDGRHHWETASDYLMPEGFNLDLWEDQPKRIEVWVEKRALIGVVDRAARDLRVPSLACKGYMSQTAAWQAGRRALKNWMETGKRTVIIHLGDHDPSGIDMTRDNWTRLNLFTCPSEEDPEGDVPYDAITVERIALNWDQIEEHRPPPNPAKMTDSRAGAYVARYGHESWELDALNPRTLDGLIKKAVSAHLDIEKWEEVQRRERGIRKTLHAIEGRWGEVEELFSED
ncbi:MAG: hypothetical protein V3S01_05600 [Dehalococcoidia bacterium]